MTTLKSAASTEQTADRKVSHADAREYMANWREYRGRTPFGNMSSGFAIDRANSHLGNASAILRFMSLAFEDAAELGDKSELANMHMSMFGAALDGVDDLINLAAFAVGE